MTAADNIAGHDRAEHGELTPPWKEYIRDREMK